MKALGGILVVMAALAGYLACATTGPDPCIGSFEARQSMPCWCATQLNPGCVPPLSDSKRPTTDGGISK